MLGYTVTLCSLFCRTDKHWRSCNNYHERENAELWCKNFYNNQVLYVRNENHQGRKLFFKNLKRLSLHICFPVLFFLLLRKVISSVIYFMGEELDVFIMSHKTLYNSSNPKKILKLRYRRMSLLRVAWQIGVHILLYLCVVTVARITGYDYKVLEKIQEKIVFSSDAG